MTEDIAPKLLEILKTSFYEKFDESEVVAELAKKLASETADYKDANAFAVEIGQILAGVYQENLSSDVLPDGRMYYNIAKRIIEPTMKDNYELASAFSQDVQTALNHKAKIGIKGIKAPLKDDKIRGIVERLSEEEDFDAAKWLLDEPVVTFTQSVVNDTIEENTKFAYKAGLRPKIVRTEVGNCCEWCKEVAGTYEYPKVPKDVYRRHNRCRCTVEYFPGDGKKQDVYSKKWVDIGKDEKVKERKKLSQKGNFSIDAKQFGKKAGKHMKDYGLDVSSEEERQAFISIINKIVENHDRVIRNISWRGQKETVIAYIKGEDVVITNKMNEFITVLKGGATNARIKNTGK